MSRNELLTEVGIYCVIKAI